MDFWDAVRAQIRKLNTKVESVAAKAGISVNTLNGWMNKGRMPRADEAARLAQALETTVDCLLSGKSVCLEIGSVHESSSSYGYNQDDAVLVPILSQKVAAGNGQELLATEEVVGQLPFLRRMLRGGEPLKARAIEVRGDSMTGIQLFDGDLVVFIPGIVRGDGIYVLQVGDELIVKRVEFDPVSRKIRIMSENSRYPDRVESADGQTVSVVGKVYGWVHSHPY